MKFLNRVQWGAIGVMLAAAVGCKHHDHVAAEQPQGGTFIETSAPVVAEPEVRAERMLLDETLGAGGGLLIGATKQRIVARDRLAASDAIQSARLNPAAPQMALTAKTADVNGDGFVTLDEIVALQAAGLTELEIVQRVRAGDYVFEMTDGQRNTLRQRGVTEGVITGIPIVNDSTRERLLNTRLQ